MELSRSNLNIGKINSLLADSLDWALIQKRADYHGVAPLIYYRLKQLLNNPIPKSPDKSRATGQANLSREMPVRLSNRDPSNALNDLNVPNDPNDLNASILSPITYHLSPKLIQSPNDVMTGLSNDPVTQLPSNVIQFFRQAYYENLARNITLFQELKEILKALSKHGIKVMVLKGAALAETIYQNLALRPMSDLDLLIRKDDLERVEKQLIDLGYSPMKIEFSGWWAERFGGERLYVKEANFPMYVDIHWNIANCTWMKRDQMKIEMDRIWSEARPMKIVGVDTLSMPLEDQILYASAHLTAHHQHFRLIWLRDICDLTYQYQGQIDWEKIVERARQWKLERPLHCYFKYAGESLGAQIPGEILDELRPFDTNNLEARFFSLHLDPRDNKLGVIEHFYRYLKIPGMAEKVRFLLGAMFPSVAYLRNRYSVPKSRVVYFYYLYRPCYILYRAGVALIKLMWMLISKKLKAHS